MDINNEIYYCDNDCGCDEFTGTKAYFIEKLPCDIATANKGESAVLCKECYNNLIKGD